MTGLLIGNVGPGGSGKSHLLRSCAAVGKTAVALTDPLEEVFYKGTPNLTYEIFDDDDEWRPAVNQFETSAYNRLAKWIAARYNDDTKFVGLDNGTELSDVTMHAACQMYSIAAPGDIGYGKAYTAHDSNYISLIRELRRLTKKGKIVIVNFHGKMKEMEGAGMPEKKPGFQGTELQFEEKYLPVMATSLRQSISQMFPLWLHAKTTGSGPGTKYFVTAIPDEARAAKNRVKFKSKVNGRPVLLSMLPNTMKELLEVIETDAKA